MHWLSQMLHTQIDLNRMYPADKPRDYSKRQTKNQDNFLLATIKRENEGTMRVLKVLGDESLTSREIAERMCVLYGKEKIRKDTINSKLKRMTEYGYLERHVPASKQGIKYSVVK